ncbi:MAG: hypothetical protein A2X31_11425 [Elusimicrobia bacterium GWB2_63_22]|nr:MAG: hypothetical protein A2X31_11425 [Elusimicrobia bacterium GWB2_63_22]
MLALPAFAEESLVCPETCTGDSAGDWRPASQLPEIASAMSVGVGRTVATGVMSGSYESETGFSSTVRYFEDRDPSAGSSYGELLDSIDNILGAYKDGGQAPAQPQETDYDLAEKFDIRLSRIQEELEAARWEKNLLLEKIRMKESEERKNRERIQELEARLKGELGKADVSAKELEQVRHLADLKAKAETLKQIEEIRKEELSLKEDIKADAAAPVKAIPAPQPLSAAEPLAAKAQAEPAPAPAVAPEQAAAEMIAQAEEPEIKSFKSMKRSSEMKLESSLHREMKEPEDDAGLTSRKFKSLGPTQAPAYVYGSHYDKPLPGPEAAPPGAFKPEALEPLPQQAGGVIYDFTVVTSKPDVQQFQIETRYEAPAQAQQAPAAQPQPVKPPTYDFGVPAQAAPAPQPQPAPAPAQVPAQAPAFGATVQHGFQFQPQAATPAQKVDATATPAAAAPLQAPEAQTFQPSAQPAPAADKKGPEAPAESPDKTLRIPVAAVKAAAPAKAPEKKPRRGGKMAFLTILVVFGSMAAGGLGYFFLGEGVSLSELTMLNLGGKKKAQELASQLEDKGEASQPVLKAEPAGVDEDALQPAATQPAAQPAGQETPPAAPEKPANENIRKSLEIVKDYKLSGGRGTIKSWFANAFLSGAAGGTNEEWTATPLHGDILVVQYRLLRPKQEPMVYQFEVDAAKQDIVRGINNNAIELLDFSGGEKSVSAAPVRKPARAKAKKPARKSGEIAQLPLPDAPAAGPAAEEAPTGFEDGQAEGSEEVKYLKAQESDEELF